MHLFGLLKCFFSRIDIFNTLLNESIHLFENSLVDVISFGGPYDLEHGVLQSKNIENISENFYICDKVIGCQCVVIGKHFCSKIKKYLLSEKWDALDSYLTNISKKNNFKLGVSQKTIVSQFNGKSDIDGYEKQFKEFEL